MNLDEFLPVARPGWSGRWRQLALFAGTVIAALLICTALWFGVLWVGAVQ